MITSSTVFDIERFGGWVPSRSPPQKPESHDNRFSMAERQMRLGLVDVRDREFAGASLQMCHSASVGIRGFHLQDIEAVLHQEVSAQYRNWFEPAGAVQPLRRISDNSPLTIEHTDCS